MSIKYLIGTFFVTHDQYNARTTFKFHHKLLDRVIRLFPTLRLALHGVLL